MKPICVFGSRIVRKQALPELVECHFINSSATRFLTYVEKHTNRHELVGVPFRDTESTHVKRSVRVPFMLNSNEWHFDTDILIQFHEAELRIVEKPIPTYYGD
jgi:hypothetical protein